VTPEMLKAILRMRRDLVECGLSPGAATVFTDRMDALVQMRIVEALKTINVPVLEVANVVHRWSLEAKA
jgi:hypothetical protein